MSFKDDFSKAKSTEEQQRLIYEAAIKQGPPSNFYPITTKLPDGRSITYRVMPDYLAVGGVRVPMTAATAQKLANAWGMVLPTAKMTEQIFQEAKNKGGAIAPTPLSSGGYKDPVTGKTYTGRQVVDTQIGAPSASLAYNQLVDKEVSKNPNAPIYAGHGKTILQANPGVSDRLHFVGIERTVQTPAGTKTIQIQPKSSPHAYDTHSEYITLGRFSDNKVTVTNPDGTKIEMTMDQLLSDPALYKAVSDTKGLHTYNVGKSPAGSAPTATAKVTAPAATKQPSAVAMKPSTPQVPTGQQTLVDIASKLKNLEKAIGSGLGRDVSGLIINASNSMATDFEDIDRSVRLCVGYLMNCGNVKEAQAIVDALDVSLKDEAPSATTFVVPRDVTQTALYLPTESQQIGRSQTDPPKVQSEITCDNCNTVIDNIFLIDDNACPSCKKSLKK